MCLIFLHSVLISEFFLFNFKKYYKISSLTLKNFVVYRVALYYKSKNTTHLGLDFHIGKRFYQVFSEDPNNSRHVAAA